MSTDWDKIFREAHLHSWPTASLSIQNRNPSPGQGSRNIFLDEEKPILAAAKRHGYEIVTPLQSAVVSFIRRAA